MRFKNFILFLSIWAGAGFLQAADTYSIDQAHSSVGFSVKHLMISNVKGSFKDFSGVILFDDKNVSKSSVKITIKAASVDTGIGKRDEHLKTPDFFDAQKFPEVTFSSTKVTKTASGYSMDGKLTLKGVTKDVTIPFTLSDPVQDPWGMTRFGAEGALTINRTDYGINWNKALDKGGVMVGNDVKIELQVEAVKQVPAAK